MISRCPTGWDDAYTRVVVDRMSEMRCEARVRWLHTPVLVVTLNFVAVTVTLAESE